MILFQLLFEVADDKKAEFEKTYAQVFEPALKKQKGFQNVRFFRFYAPAQAAEIEASPTEYNYQINFVFDSEASRRVRPESFGQATSWSALLAHTRRLASASNTKLIW